MLENQAKFEQQLQVLQDTILSLQNYVQSSATATGARTSAEEVVVDDPFEVLSNLGFKVHTVEDVSIVSFTYIYIYKAPPPPPPPPQLRSLKMMQFMKIHRTVLALQTCLKLGAYAPFW